MSDLVPLDRLAIPPALTGEAGRNRAHGTRQVDANDDRSAVLAWLARYVDSPATLSSYRKEAERLLLWCVHQRKRAPSDLSHEDMPSSYRLHLVSVFRSRFVAASSRISSVRPLSTAFSM